MFFDLISFLAGILAGGLTGTLAGILYGYERTADLQENLLKLRKEINDIDSANPSNKPRDAVSEERLRELRADLDSIREEIRRMYRKSAG